MVKKDFIKFNIFLSIFVIVIFSIALNVEAESFENDIQEYSKYYLEWLNLTEEEKSETLVPLTFNVGINNNNKSRFRMLFSYISNSTIPERYNLKDFVDIDVRYQGSNNICWAYAANSMLESTILKTELEQYDFSEKHMEYDTSLTFNDGLNPLGLKREVNVGGNMQIAFTYWTRGSGPILEEDMPKVSGTKKISLNDMPNASEVKKIDGTKYFPNIFKYEENGNIICANANGEIYTKSEVEEIRNDIKKHIINYGCVATSVYLENTSDCEYCNPKNGAFNYNGSKGANHAVTIIGWDDNYSVDNFPENHRPSKPGAYIILNSWGEEWGDKGIGYASYEDFLIESSNYGVTSVSNIDYDNLYQYDTNSMTTSLNTYYAANVFEKESDTKEYLSEIMIGVTSDKTCEIYVNAEGEELSSDKLKKVSGTYNLVTGYNTIKLDESIELTGEKFAVAVKIISNNPGVGIESTSYINIPNSNEGESYTGTSLDKWKDIYNENDMMNFCIKAYTKVENKSYELGDLSYVTKKIIEGFGGEAQIEFRTTAIENKNEIIVKILKDSLDVTSNFEISKNIITSKKADINISALPIATAGTYTVEVYYKTFKETRTFEIEPMQSYYESISFNDKYLYEYFKFAYLNEYIITYKDDNNLLLVNKDMKEKIGYISLFKSNVSDLSGLEVFPNISFIYLDYTNIKDFSVLSKFPNLQYLYITNNNLNDIEFVKNLDKLEELDLSNNNIKDISTLKNLTKLNNIKLINNKIDNVEVLKELNNIACLDVSEQKIDDIKEIAYDEEILEVSVPLPEIFVQAKTKGSNVYTENDFILTNCKLDTTGKNILIDVSELCQSKVVQVTINGGNANNTVYNLKYSVKDKIVKNIEISAPPSNISYIEGQKFNESGMIVKIVYTDDSEEETLDYKVLSGDYLEVGQTKVIVQYSGNRDITTTQDIIVEEKKLDSIQISTPAAKTQNYIEGQNFNNTGMIVEAIYNDASSKRITNYTIIDGNDLSLDASNITISYTENGVTKTTEQEISVIERKLESIKILNRPNKVSYIEGSDFDPSGMKVVLVYNDLIMEETTNYTLLDNKNLGLEQTNVIIQYNEDTNIKTYQEISVNEKEVVSIEVTELPTTTYVAGQKFDYSGMIITATYNDSSAQEIDCYNIINGNDLKLNQDNVIVQYMGNTDITTTVPINVIERKVERIGIYSAPFYEDYIVGHNFNTKDMIIKLIYNDGTEEMTNDYTVLNGENLSLGQTSVTVQYNGDTSLTLEQPITVEERKVKYIRVSIVPNKIAYIEGENFDPTGMKIIATYNDYTMEALTDYTIIDGNNLTTNQNSVTIQYNENTDITTTQKITVEKRKITGLKIIVPPNKTEYVEGEDFNTNGMVVKAIYNDGSEEEVTNYTIVNGNNLVANQASVTIQYNENMDITTTQSIIVAERILQSISIITNPSKTTYIEGENFNADGMVVKAIYDNNTEEEVTDYTILDGSNLTLGQTLVTIQYLKNGITKTTTQKIAVKAKTLQSISITTPPTKTTYIVGETFNTNGMVVKAVYDNNTKEEITDYTVLNGNNLTLEQTSVTIQYVRNNITKTAIQTITVLEETTELYTLIDTHSINLNSVDGIITGIPPEKTSSDILTQFENILDGVKIKIYKTYENGSNNNIELGVTERVGTGMKLIVERNGQLVEEYTIVIYGEVNGDGKINIFDITAIVDHILEKNILTGVKLSAANANRGTDEKVNIFDIIAIVDHILEKESIVFK